MSPDIKNKWQGKRTLLASLLCLSICGCVARYPMGLTQGQWESLSPPEQAEYQAQQRQIEADERARREAWRQEQRRIEEARAEREAAILQVRYANARYGDLVRITIQGGRLEYYGKARSYYPVAFELIRGEEKAVKITQIGQIRHTATFLARLTEDGHTFYFDEGAAEQFVAVNNCWDRGECLKTSTSSRRPGIRLLGATVCIQLVDRSVREEKVVIVGEAVKLRSGCSINPRNGLEDRRFLAD